MVMLQAFNGAGDTVTPTIVNFFGFWLLEFPWPTSSRSPSACSQRRLLAIVIAEGFIAAVSIVSSTRPLEAPAKSAQWVGHDTS